MLELILLPWILFKYLFSLGLWAGLFMTIHYQWKKRCLTEKIILFGDKIFKRNQKSVNADLDDHYNNL